MPEIQAQPEQLARAAIDGMLGAAGWQVQDYQRVDLTAERGVAVREFMTEAGPVDYMLFAEGKAIGTVEAKRRAAASRPSRGSGASARAPGSP